MNRQDAKTPNNKTFLGALASWRFTEFAWIVAAGSALSLVPFTGAARSEPPPKNADTAELTALARIEGGAFEPLYGSQGERVQVASFDLEVHAVTNAQFLRFVSTHPKWQRDQVAPVFADRDYLRHWQGPLRLGAAPLDAPVTNVSWFAARALCASRGRRLPTLAEWEYAARADATRRDAQSDTAFTRRLLDWYAKPTPTPLPSVRSTERNVWGVWDMHGLVWEWVEDFNAVLLTGESRKDGSGLDPQLFCAGGAAGSVDPSNYAAFMRYAARASAEAAHAVSSLGFRCAASVENAEERP